MYYGIKDFIPFNFVFMLLISTFENFNFSIKSFIIINVSIINYIL